MLLLRTLGRLTGKVIRILKPETLHPSARTRQEGNQNRVNSVPEAKKILERQRRNSYLEQVDALIGEMREYATNPFVFARNHGFKTGKGRELIEQYKTFEADITRLSSNRDMSYLEAQLELQEALVEAGKTLDYLNKYALLRAMISLARESENRNEFLHRLMFDDASLGKRIMETAGRRKQSGKEYSSFGQISDKLYEEFNQALPSSYTNFDSFRNWYASYMEKEAKRQERRDIYQERRSQEQARLEKAQVSPQKALAREEVLALDI